MNREIEEREKHREVAVFIADSVGDLERAALLCWTQGLLQIRESNMGRQQKLLAAARITKDNKVIIPMAKLIAEKLKEVVWNNRSTRWRVGFGTGAAAFAVFGSQGAGVAALGTAIGLPLWFVFGAGASFAWMLVEELQAKKPTKTTYTIEGEEKH